MTIREAMKICNDFDRKTNPSEEEAFLFTEAARFLIEETKDPRAMLHLGGWYYEQKDFDLALKYYELAAEYNYEPALEGLGYIWYYGRTGTRDYEKAFHYYEKAAKQGNPVCTYKLADMYRNGYYVEKDEAKYREIVEGLYEARPTISDMRYYPLPEIYTRLARIRMEEGRLAEAEGLLLEAKDDLANRIVYNPFFGNLSIMRGLIGDLYEVRETLIREEYGYEGRADELPAGPLPAAVLTEGMIDLFDLYQLLETPVKIRFCYEMFADAEGAPYDPEGGFAGREYTVEALEEDGAVVIRFDSGDGEHWYRSVGDFFEKAEIGGERIVTLYYDLYDFEVCDG